MTLKVDLDAMTADAHAWHAASDVLKNAKSSAGALTLTESVFCFAGGEVAALYEAARKQVEDFLDVGSKETDKAADTLTQVRDDFQSTDLSERDRHVGAWNPQ